METDQPNAENGNGGIPDGAVLLPKEFVARIKGRLGEVEFENEFLKGQVAAQDHQIAQMQAHIQQLESEKEVVSTTEG